MVHLPVQVLSNERRVAERQLAWLNGDTLSRDVCLAPTSGWDDREACAEAQVSCRFSMASASLWPTRLT